MSDIAYIVYDIDEGHASVCDTKEQAEEEVAVLVDDGVSVEDIRIYVANTVPKRVRVSLSVDWEAS